MRRGLIVSILTAGIFFGGVLNSFAADKFDLTGIGTMVIPKNMTIKKGAQEALPFLSDGGTKRFFLRRGITSSEYYTMTWKQGPDFSYGWAMSHKLGIPFLLEIGEISHKGDSPVEQMDIIAAYFNKQLINDGAIFEGDAPLMKIKDRRHPRWEGFFRVPRKENGIVYNEAYTLILQCDGYFTTLGILNTDGDRSDITNSIRDMIMKRKFPRKETLLNFSST